MRQIFHSSQALGLCPCSSLLGDLLDSRPFRLRAYQYLSAHRYVPSQIGHKHIVLFCLTAGSRASHPLTWTSEPPELSPHLSPGRALSIFFLREIEVSASCPASAGSTTLHGNKNSRNVQVLSRQYLVLYSIK
jgi:hypothetical protein